MEERHLNLEINPVFTALIEAVKAALNGTKYTKFNDFTDEQKENFYKTAKYHAVAALISLSTDDPRLADRYNATLYKNVMFAEELDRFTVFCDKNKIWNYPMKGTSIEMLYPSFGTREMSDRDILVDGTQRAKIRDFYVREGYTVAAYNVTNHDVYQKQPFYNFEIHTALFREEDVESFADYYKDAYPRLLKHTGQSMKCEMSESDMYVFNLAHIIKHYLEGGIQIKSLVDIYVMLTKLKNLDWNYIEEEETKLGTVELERVLRSLSRKIFEDGQINASGTTLTDEEAKVLEIVTFYGQFSTDLALLQRKLAKKSKFRMILESAFPGADGMKERYPRAGRIYPLYPILWLVRIITMLVNPRKRAIAKAQANKITTETELSSFDKLRLETIHNQKLL